MDLTTDSPYNYKLWMNQALLEVVQKIIRTIEHKGLCNGIHFFITINTKHPLLKVPVYLLEKYPDNMTIVLQNKFNNLTTEPGGFRVSLYFSSKLTELFIPWTSIIQVLDPITPISLKIDQLETTNMPTVIRFPKQKQDN